MHHCQRMWTAPSQSRHFALHCIIRHILEMDVGTEFGIHSCRHDPPPPPGVCPLTDCLSANLWSAVSSFTGQNVSPIKPQLLELNKQNEEVNSPGAGWPRAACVAPHGWLTLGLVPLLPTLRLCKLDCTPLIPEEWVQSTPHNNFYEFVLSCGTTAALLGK